MLKTFSGMHNQNVIALGIKKLLKHFKQGNNGVHLVISFLNYIKFFKLKYIYIYFQNVST